MKFWYLVKVVRSRILLIVGLAVVTLLVIYVGVPKPQVVYPATVLVSPTAQVMRGGVSTTNTASQTSNNQPDRNVILSNLIILAQGGEVYERAREFLELPVKQQATKCPGLPLYKRIPRIETEPGQVLTVADWPDVLEVSPVQNAAVGEKGTTTDIIRITVKLTDASLSPYVANAVAYAFADTYQDKSRSDTKRYAKFLESSREEVGKRLHELQQKIVKYKNARGVLEVNAETQNAISSIAQLEATRSQAQAAAREATAAVADINIQLAREPLVLREPLPADMNPQVQTLKAELSKAEGDLQEVAQHYRPAHDVYKLAQARVNSLKQRIAKEGAHFAPPTINQVRVDLLKRRSDAEYNLATARARLASISASLARAQAKADSLARAEPGLVELMREYSQQESAYKTIAERLTQAQVAEEEFTKTGSIIMLDPSRGALPKEVLGPTRKVLMVYGLLLSLIVGIAASVWFDSIDNRMRNAADVEKMLELPAVGLTPQLTGRDGNLPKLTHIYPLSPMAESYRILRTNVLFALRDTPFKTLMVATGRPGQGATTTICNLAIALAQIGKRIILIDADMRRPSLHKFFGVSNETGLSTLLRDECKLTDVFRKTEVDNLLVIPGGPQPLNPSELLGSERMHEIVEMLQEHCDLVLFDTPSTIVFSDGPMLASWVDAVLMVVSANQAPRGTEVVTRDLLRRANANIIGVVVNRMQEDLVDSCYYYSHYYGDSVPGNGSAKALESGEMQGDDGTKKAGSAGPKAIPAAAGGVPASGDEDNPFPD